MSTTISPSVTSEVDKQTFSANGAICFWTLKSADLSELQPGLTLLGMKKYIPKERTPSKALKLATTKIAKQYFKDLYQRKHATHEVVVIPRKDIDTATYDVYVPGTKVTDYQKPKNLTPLFTTNLEAVTPLHYATRLVLHQPNLANQRPAINLSLAHEYKTRVAQCDTHQLSHKMILMLIGEFDATCLRNCGGLYWLPQHNINQWRAIAKLIEKAAPGSEVHVLTVKADRDIIRAVKGAISIEIVQALKTLALELDNPKLGKKALKSKQKKVAALSRKVADYEQLIGGTLQSLEDACDVARGLIAQTELTQLGL